ncbi:MAG: hypothetical protein GF364_02555 [Candidatus Lokiarchaeota archaeon]|nr:hypothetical protein [Candidatus Lokiarchaeota archaeon]
MIQKIRISIGSASKLGLRKISMDAFPTNIHLLTYNSGGCVANCAFCPQSRYTFKKLEQIPNSQKFLSRVNWPIFSFPKLLDILKTRFPKPGMDPAEEFQRICIQSLNYPKFSDEVLEILKSISSITNIPISLAIPPVKDEFIYQYKESGAERICFALDASTPKLFTNIKGKGNSGPYVWEKHIERLQRAVQIFGKGYTTTHLIIGFGESEYDALHLIYKLKKMGILTGLFPFCPIKNTKFEDHNKPSIRQFRIIQLGKYLIDTSTKSFEDFQFSESGSLISYNISQQRLQDIINTGIPFLTSGCPGCNRPYYTSSPSEEQYNFPRSLTTSEKKKILKEIKLN